MVGVQGWTAVSEGEGRPAAEAALLRAGRAGDRAALGQLLALHERALVAFCLGILGNLEDAEDAAQETFLRALQGLAGFRGEAGFRTWLFRIAVNLCLRWKAARRPTEPWDEERESTTSSSPPPEAIVLDRLRRMEALGSLPRRQRVIFLLKEWEGWSAVEIARVMGCNEMRVRNELSKARRTLVAWRRKDADEGEAG
jgi:RNA polymerase sigma-70 factor (ECF subfamily)